MKKDTIYWVFNSIETPPEPITFAKEDDGWLVFIDKEGDEVEEDGDFLNPLDPDIFDKDGEYLWAGYHDADPGDIGDWWVGIPFSTKEKALAARRAAAEEAIRSLELRIQASNMQTYEDLEEIKRLDSLEEQERLEEERINRIHQGD